MKICVICDDYPSIQGNNYVFVQQLCHELTRQGHEITVIAPQSITKNIIRHLPILPYRREEKIDNATITIYSPLYLSISNLGNKSKFIESLKRYTIEKVIKKNKIKPDIFYAHFWKNLKFISSISEKMSVPLFVATGEADVKNEVGVSITKQQLKPLKGIIAVSRKNLRESEEIGLVRNTASQVIPNAIDATLFRKLDKKSCRKELGLPDDAFIVAFTGGFIHRKGPGRVAQAIQELNDPQIKSVFIGKEFVPGKDDLPECDGILFRGEVSHEKIPLYLNAADLFVLPTLAEGCCNAIVEAMACGLPVISSDRDFNYDILDQSNAILIDPLSIEDIKKGIKLLKDDSRLREAMSQASLMKSKSLSLNQRASNIIDFISSNSRSN